MTFVAFTGCAGCGKTHQLMEHLSARCRRAPLPRGQKILALTFMHGSRKRLEARLGQLDLAGAGFECTVVDRFAAQLLHRWRALAAHFGLGPFEDDDYDGRCAAAATLLGAEHVRQWVVAAYPIILLDEAHDLKPERLAIFEALEWVSDLYVAADGFQCLDPALRDSAALAWTTKDNRHTELTQIHRTDKKGLLDAARALREGQACPRSGAGFNAYADSKGPNFANFNAAMALGTNKWTSAAIITPTMKSKHVLGLIERLQEKPIGGKRPFGPYTITVETGPEKLADEIMNAMALPDRVSLIEAQGALEEHAQHLAARRTVLWLARQMRVVGKTEIGKEDLSAALHRQAKESSRYAPSREIGLQAMTVHGAKNREFDGVVALWPYEAGGDDEQKRRLLYNAITRAKDWCTVICMSDKQLKHPPFV